MHNAKITIENAAGICLIQFDRPEKKNAITRVMYQAMADALTSAACDPLVKVVVLASSSENFTAGNDLADFLQDPSMANDSPVYQFLQALVKCPVPVLAAVSGFAIGIGSTLLLHCEQVFADHTARFCLPFINLGLVPEAGSSMLLPRLIGYQKAADLLLTGRVFDAEEALALGFVGHLVANPKESALEYAALLAAKPRETLIEVKRLLRKDDEPLQSRLEDELASFVHQLQLPAVKEKLEAFLQKRSSAS